MRSCVSIDCLHKSILLSGHDDASKHPMSRSSRTRLRHWRLAAPNLRGQTKPPLCQRNLEGDPEVKSRRSRRLVFITACHAHSECNNLYTFAQQVFLTRVARMTFTVAGEFPHGP